MDAIGEGHIRARMQGSQVPPWEDTENDVRKVGGYEGFELR